MPLKLIGAGLGRTGTASLKVALERLLGGRCHHMVELFEHPEQIEMWQAVVDGQPPDWDALLDGYEAAVDYPAAAFWRELADAYPDAPVVLSVRATSQEWWESARDTIFARNPGAPPPPRSVPARQAALGESLLVARFTPDYRDREAAIAAYEAHNAAVRREIPPARLIEWHPADGWKPLCAALGVPVPLDVFPHLSTRTEFRRRAGLDIDPEAHA